MHLPFLLRKRDVDVLHMPWFYAPAIVPSRLVMTVHDLTDVLMPPPGVAPPVQAGRLYFARRALRARRPHPGGVAFLQARTVAHVRRSGRKDRESSTTRSMSVSCASRCPPTPTASWNATPSTDPFVLYAGNIKPQKNLPRLIEAFAVAKAELRDHPEICQLETAVDRRFAPSEHSDLRRAVVCARACASDVRFLGFVPHAVLRVFYSRARAFLFPSLYEGFGLPPLEAMAHGAPVLTSNVSSLPEVFTQAALLVNPENVFEIARGIRQILTEDDLRETLIRRGYERARLYSWERAAQLVREAYDGVL